jgi:gustatory receptor
LKNVGPAGVIADYRALWLRLSKLTRDTGTTTCFTFTFLNLYLFFVITMSVYGLMAKLSSSGLEMKDLGLTITVFCSVSLLYFICDEAHIASYNVKKLFQKKILMVELCWMNLDATVEINMFLRATEMNQAHINLGGFFNVDRNLFKSVRSQLIVK